MTSHACIFVATKSLTKLARENHHEAGNTCCQIAEAHVGSISLANIARAPGGATVRLPLQYPHAWMGVRPPLGLPRPARVGKLLW